MPMPLRSHRQAAERNFDCFYDPNYTVPSEKDTINAKRKATSNASVTQIFPKYNEMFTQNPIEQRMEFRQRLPQLPPNSSGLYHLKQVPRKRRLTAGTDIIKICNETNEPNAVTTNGQRKSSTSYDKNKIDLPRPTQLELKFSYTNMDSKIMLHNRCLYYDFSPKKRCNTKGTQTLYRESSAQTLPYLPGVANEKEELDEMELFKLPTILPGDGPPGLYEVEVLERSRKRWAFAKALKANFKAQLEEAKAKAKLPQNTQILAAFEWEHWIEREEYIQECQMMRLELVIRMFDKREKEMHDKSKTRLQMSCDLIKARKNIELENSENRLKRELRLLSKRNENAPLRWRKQNIVDELGKPNLEFYAPQMRYGFNAARRNFVGGRKAFETRMDDLEKRAVNMNNMECPFAKLKQWSKPKERIKEVEQNFCTDSNLKKLYESLKQLRVQATNKKATPKCLILKPKQEKRSYYPRDSSDSSEGSKETIDEAAELLRFKEEERNHRQHVDAIFLKSMQEKRYRFQLLTELRLEEMDALIADYSGSTIGWLMRFLTEEMIRLKELRKIHFISLLAQKERWRREAAEAGLRQKENNMRLIYEDLYNKANMSNIEVSQDYLNSIINVDLHEFAEEGAAERTVELAKSIDNDIQEWLNSFDKIQNPLNFDTLRCTLRDVVFPDVTHLAHMYESSTAADYIINEVLFPNIFNLLEPYDIASAITDEHISRLIDDDLYIFSPECDSDCNCQPFCGCKNAKRESEAIIRKIIRRSVPGRRWKTETERIVHENLTEIVESALKSATHCLEYKYVTRPMIPAASHRNLRYKYNKEPDYISNSSSASNGSQYLKDGVRTRISRTKAMTSSRITRELEREESLLYNDISLHSAGIDDTGTVIDFGNVEEPMMKQESEATLYFTKSTFNILRQGSVQKSFVQFAPDPDTTSSSFDDIGIIFADVNCSPLKLERKNNKKYMEYMVKELVHNFIPAEENESDPSVFEEEILKRSSLKQPRLTANDESDDEDIADIYNADYEDDADDDDDDNFEPTIKSILRKIISKILPHDKETVMFKDDLRVTSHKSARIMVAEDVKELEAVSDINEEEELISLLSEDKYELFITESSLMRLQQMECKCTVEREKERYIMNLMKEGKVKIIRKPKLEEEQMEEEQQEEELQMESDKWQFSEYKEEVEEQDVMSNIEEKSQLTIEVEMAKENSEKEETEKKQTEKEKTDQEQTEIEQTVTETDEASTTAVVAPPSAEELPAINETAAADPKEQPSADQGTTAVESSNTKLQGPEPEAEVNPNETAVETTAEAAAEASAEP